MPSLSPHDGQLDDAGVAVEYDAAAEQDECRRYINEVLETLRQAAQAGFKDWNRLRQEADFASLLSHPEFQQLLAAQPATSRPR